MMKVTTWGTRGSLPTAGSRSVRHGGSTTCIEIELDAKPGTPTRVIMDCGSGLAELGRRKFGVINDAVFLQTHHHWDHIQGFPFFGPLFKPEAAFDFYSVPRDGQSLEDSLKAQMTAPSFPIGLEMVPAKLQFHSIFKSGVMALGDLVLSWAEMTHPSGSTAWRLDYRGTSLVFSGDCEVQSPTSCRRELCRLSEGADLLIMDAQYTPQEYGTRIGWGHSTPEDAVGVATEAGVGRLLLTHHDPSHDDEKLDAKAEFARQIAGQLLVANAHDGLQLELKNQHLALAS